MQSKDGLYAMKGLSQEALLDIRALAKVCNAYEQLDLKLNWGMLQSRSQDETNDFLYYEQGELVGYLALFIFNPHEAEVSGMVSPQKRRQGIFTTLLEAARKECRQRDVPAFLFIVQHASTSGLSAAASLHAQYDHSEYKMILEQTAASVQYIDSPLLMRPAQVDDIPALSHITAVSFGMPEHDVDWYNANMLDDPAHAYYVAFVDNVCVGKIDVNISTQTALILGFGVLPEYQRRGYGKQILLQTIQAIQKRGSYQIILEVETKNEHALGLYSGSGFKQTGRYDYFRLAIPVL
jgi:ribosomal protein S18 acetylase RimI-like enzyme